MRLVAVLGALIAVVELLIMLVAHDTFIPAVFSESAWDYVDTTLLTLIVAPALYFLIFRKLQENITELQHAQQALEESTQHTQTIVDNIIDGLITIDSRGCPRCNQPADVQASS
jgi:PAS domain-containing protein